MINYAFLRGKGRTENPAEFNVLPQMKTEMPVPESSGARKYVNEVAEGYDTKREQTEKYKVEQDVLYDLLRGIPSGTRILDVPVGTGRLFEFYKNHGLRCAGIDLSQDMLEQARKKASSLNYTELELAQGDLFNIDFPEDFADAGVMIRLTRWISPEQCVQAFRILQRAISNYIILTTRISGPHARPLELFTENLQSGWQMAANRRGYVDDYRILAFGHKK